MVNTIFLLGYFASRMFTVCLNGNVYSPVLLKSREEYIQTLIPWCEYCYCTILFH